MSQVFNSLFQKVYVVSLPEDKERRENISRQLWMYDIEPVFVDGVRIKNLNDKFFKFPNFYKRNKPKSEEEETSYRKRICGTYLAHLNALDKMMDLEEDTGSLGMILEDDIILCPNFVSCVENLVDDLTFHEEWMCCNLQSRLYKKCLYDGKTPNYYRGNTWGHQGFIYNKIDERSKLEKFVEVIRWGCNEEIDNFYTRLVEYFPMFGSTNSIVAQCEDFESRISTRKDYINKA